MSYQQTQAVLASLVEMRSELAGFLEDKFEKENEPMPYVHLISMVMAHPSISRADALIAELTTGAA